MSISEVFLIGSIIRNRYEIVRRIGKGGSGRVYYALDKKLANSPRAIKQLAVDYIDYDQYSKAIEDFKREAKVLADLEHPSIPRIYDYFTSAGYFFLVMNYVEGNNLEQMLQESSDGRLPERTVTKWGIQLCDTLAYIHGLNPPIIYRDMKPANVIYDESIDRVILIDFGIARYVQSSTELVTAVGTEGYAPPELYKGRVSPASDTYSLGATMFHLLTGVAPGNNSLKFFDFSTNPRPRQINDKITETMEIILIKAVEVKPENRFASAGEMKSALEEHLAAITENVKPPRPADLPEDLPESLVGQFVPIPAGEFMMGSNNGFDAEKPVHKVTISRSFEMGKYTVTQAQWEAVMGRNPSAFKGSDLPVEGVTWEDARKFIRKLNDKSKIYKYRLPTEAEWEYACRSGSEEDYAGVLDQMAWYSDNSGDRTHPVGQKQPNAWGLYDMHGNVWEWCQDKYGSYPIGEGTDPNGPSSGTARILRGGGWSCKSLTCRSAIRNWFAPGKRIGGIGFRLLRTAK